MRHLAALPPLAGAAKDAIAARLVEGLSGGLELEEGHRRLSVFGLMGTLNSQAGVIVFVLLLVYLIMLGEGFERLEVWAQENDVFELIDKLKEELMMMGILSFTIFIYIEAAGGVSISSGSKVYNYYLAFEMSHVILLFITIAFIFQGAYLLSYAIKQGKSYLKSKRISAEDLVEEITLLQKEKPWQYWLFHHLPWWFPVNQPIRKRVEVKIIERLFLQYQKRDEDFRFGHYISKLFQAYIGELGNVSNRSWLVIAALVVLNYARIVALDGTWNQADYCHDEIEGAAEGHRRLGGGGSVACAIYLYGYALFIAFMIPLFCGIVLIFAKYYKTKVIDVGLSMLGVAKNGITGTSNRQHYIDALLQLQKIEKVASIHADTLRSGKVQHRESKKAQERKLNDSQNCRKNETYDIEGVTLALVNSLPVSKEQVEDELRAFKDNMKSRLEHEFDMEWKGRRCAPLIEDILFPKSFGYGNGAFMTQLFFLDSPLWFFHHVELCLLFQSMYVSIWATQLIPLTVNYPGWAIALTIPMCCNFLIIQLLLHDAVILKAVCEIHTKAIHETEEEEEMEDTCIEKMREKLEELYLEENHSADRTGKNTAVPKHVWLERKFMEYDKDKSGEISYEELIVFLSAGLGITFSHKELKILWLAVDEDLSGELQWYEFYLAVFPEDKDTIKHELDSVKTCQQLIFAQMTKEGLDASKVSVYLRGLFDKFDADQSGSIESEEFAVLIKSITGERNAPSDKDMKSMFAAIDFDKGGGVDFDEFEKLLTPPRDKLHRVMTKASQYIAVIEPAPAECVSPTNTASSEV